jgi:hypothetical protein
MFFKQAAGNLEDFLTKEIIFNHYRNLSAKLYKELHLPGIIREYLTSHEKFIRERTNNKEDDVMTNGYNSNN